MKYTVSVYHGYYGCETGCCGHIVEITDEDGKSKKQFEFSHPYGDDAKQYAIDLAKSVVSHQWPKCADSIDWDTVQVDEIRDEC